MAKLKITLVKSPISSLKDQQDTVKALGLHKVYQTVEKPDNACIRGQIFKVNKVYQTVEKPDNACIRGQIFKVKHLVKVEEA